MNSSQLSKQFSFNDIYLLVLINILFISAGIINNNFEKPKIVINKQESALNIQRNLLSSFSAGHKRLIASILWVQTLLEADDEQYSKGDLNSWMYLRFLSISMLDPLFYENYLYGGQLLAIIKDDLSGADNLYSRGLDYFPDDFYLNYHSGFTLYFEMGKFKEGLGRFKKIQSDPKAPQTLKYLIQKLEFETTHDYSSALEFLTHNLTMTKDVELREKLKQDFYALKAEKDLSCLNSRRSDCDKFDSNGEAYKIKDGLWITKNKFKPYRIFRKKFKAETN